MNLETQSVRYGKKFGDNFGKKGQNTLRRMKMSDVTKDRTQKRMKEPRKMRRGTSGTGGDEEEKGENGKRSTEGRL